MSNNTDYKRLWRNTKKDLTKAQIEINRLNNLVDGYVRIIEQIKSGEIKVDEKEQPK